MASLHWDLQILAFLWLLLWHVQNRSAVHSQVKNPCGKQNSTNPPLLVWAKINLSVVITYMLFFLSWYVCGEKRLWEVIRSVFHWMNFIWRSALHTLRQIQERAISAATVHGCILTRQICMKTNWLLANRGCGILQLRWSVCTNKVVRIWFCVSERTSIVSLNLEEKKGKTQKPSPTPQNYTSLSLSGFRRNRQ